MDGRCVDFTVYFEHIFDANGGAIVDVHVTQDSLCTKHRVIVGSDYIQSLHMTPQQIVSKTFAFLIGKKVPRQTEGILGSGDFPINYFCMSNVDQWFNDFATAFDAEEKRAKGKEGRGGEMEGEGSKRRMGMGGREGLHQSMLRKLAWGPGVDASTHCVSVAARACSRATSLARLSSAESSAAGRKSTKP